MGWPPEAIFLGTVDGPGENEGGPWRTYNIYRPYLGKMGARNLVGRLVTWCLRFLGSVMASVGPTFTEEDRYWRSL